MAATQALKTLGDEKAYEVYFAILTGERKSGGGLMDEQMKMLNDAKKLAQFGFQQGIGYVPYAGIAMGVFKAIHKDDTSPLRAAAAVALASDPDPRRPSVGHGCFRQECDCASGRARCDCSSG